MRRKGNTFSDTLHKNIPTNATIRRTSHCIKHLPPTTHYILPPGMSTEQALSKADKARCARSLMLQNETLKLDPSEIDRLDGLDFAILGPGVNYQKTPTTWSELSHFQRTCIESLAAGTVVAKPSIPRGKHTTVDTYLYFQSHYSEKVLAAERIVERHRRLDKEMQNLQELGYGVGRTWATLTRAERTELEDMAISEWIDVNQTNLYANDAAAEKAMNRTRRKLESKPNVNFEYKSQSNGSRRAKWGSYRDSDF
ncbi:UNVERIFIED_CONTAM: hypothetical protein HDU68_006307 [Siphonaria sp. JEL0065]|nr:hypothetical protein HDU68_006307 [Siphonaria sp. JEL0065]